MCLLITIVGLDPHWPLIVASNRDEERARKSAPPGLWVGERRRILSPRDRRDGGTWMGVNDLGMFAGLTNLDGATRPDGAVTRGEIPHLALDQDSLDGSVAAVREAVAAQAFAGFQLVVSDGCEIRVLEHVGGDLVERRVDGDHVVIGNEHRMEELHLPGLEAVWEQGVDIDTRFERLRDVLLDTGDHSGHRVLKLGGDYGTVSSSLIAIPKTDLHGLIWRYAPGPPDQTEYRNYGNLSRRLCDDV